MKCYQYSFPLTTLRIIGMVCLVVGLSLFLLSPLLLLFTFTEGNFDFLAIIFTSVILIHFGLLLPNLFPNLATDDKGIYIQFYLESLFVPWENVVSIHENYMSARFRSFRPSRKKDYFVLVKNKLTLIHCLTARNQGEGWRRGFLISRQILGYDELIAIIENHISQQH